MTTENNPEAKARAAVAAAALTHGFDHNITHALEDCEPYNAALDRLCTLMRTQGAVEHARKAWCIDWWGAVMGRTLTRCHRCRPCIAIPEAERMLDTEKPAEAG